MKQEKDSTIDERLFKSDLITLDEKQFFTCDSKDFYKDIFNLNTKKKLEEDQVKIIYFAISIEYK